MNKSEYKDVQVITSRQNPTVLYACKLAEKKHRTSEKKFRFDGIKLFEEAIGAGVVPELVLIKEGAFDKISISLEEQLKTVNIANIKLIEDSIFDKISEEKAPEGIICIAKRIDKFHKIIKIDNGDICDVEMIGNNDKFFALESIRDPGNLGTIIRSATAFGVDWLIISSDCAELYNPKTIRASMGTLFKQKIIITDDISVILKKLSMNGRRTYAAALSDDAVLLGKFDLLTKDCIVVGNEGHGLSDKTISACDQKLLIPMTENAESLNAAIASSICLWEQFGRNL